MISRGKILSIILCFSCISILYAQNSNPEIITIKIKRDTTLSFVLYTPDGTRDLKNKRIIFFFDPAGNGAYPVSKYMELAKKYNFALIGFNSSRNGMQFDESLRFFNITLNELVTDYGLNAHLVCLAGFSGAGKVAIKAVAQSGIKYLVYGGATVDEYLSGKEVLGFAGARDMNYTDLLDYDKSLNIKLNVHHFIIEYGGPHGWFDTTTMENTFIWLQLNFMNSGTIPRDTAFVKMLFSKYQQETDSLIAIKDWLNAYHIVKKAQYFLSASTDVKWFSAQQKFIESNSSYKKLKKETEDILEEERITRNNYDRYFFSKDTTWWKAEFERLDAKGSNARMLSNQRLSGYIWAECYYTTTDILMANDLPAAEKILSVFHLAFPGYAEPNFLSAVFYAKKNNPVKSDEFLKAAQRAGFKEWNKGNKETILQYFNRRPLK
ncbi:MAG: hypothetical protein JWN78_2629 [Bacteroidota bacterium]|nr:hypothetical protein [Bacteroidota bacterium]